MDIYQAALELHKKFNGKLEVRSKVPLTGRSELSLAYSPGVAEVSRAISKDESLAYSYTLKGNTVAVVSDGSAILGLGNLGPAAALPVMEGKCALFKSFANVDAFPICLDTQDTEEIIRTVKLIAPNFGGINLEDIAAPRCFEIEDRLKRELDIPVMHDDQHGTATVVLAGLINALKLRGLDKKTASIVINGAGAAGDAIAKLLHGYGLRQICVVDREGIIYADRPGLSPAKQKLAAFTNPDNRRGSLAAALAGAHIFIGVSAPDSLSAALVRTMAERPIIFALANPIPEIMPELAHEAGAFIVATGRSDYPNQINNVLAFPGIFRGALDRRVPEITDAMLVRAAENLAGLVENPAPEIILPDPFDPRVVQAVAQAIFVL